MAFKPEDLPNSVASSAAYPGGSGQDEVVPGASNDGTPLEEQLFNDIQGLLQGLLSNELIVADGTPDTVLASQYREGLRRLAARGGDLISIADTETMTLGGIHEIDNSGGAVTVLIPDTGLYAGAVVLFGGQPPELYSVNSVTFDAQTETIGATAQTVELKTDNLVGGFKRDPSNTKWVPFKSHTVGLEL